MKNFMIVILLGMQVVFFGCAAGPSVAERRLVAAKSIAALQQADFDNASREAEQVLTQDAENPFAALVRAVVTYKKTLHDLFLDLQSTAAAAIFGRGINARYLRYTLDNAAASFAKIDADLTTAAREPGVDLELCLACWAYDWNRNGEIDKRDRRLFEIEQDESGRKIDKEDPRRRPTFRFDLGDVLWARAFIAFHRAAVSLISALDVEQMYQSILSNKKDAFTVVIASKEKITAAKQYILQGLDLSDQCREAYLKETDDDREWLPSPKQRNHPMPLPVDDALYDTWRHIVSDVRKIVTGEEGLSLSELAVLGDIRWDVPPKGYLNLGRFFDAPETRTIRIDDLEAVDRHQNADESLGRILGPYRSNDMKHSMLIRRLSRMKNEVVEGKESIERKLRYLLWLN